MLWPQARPLKLHCVSFHRGILVGTVKILDKPGKILGHETCDGLVPYPQGCQYFLSLLAVESGMSSVQMNHSTSLLT